MVVEPTTKPRLFERWRLYRSPFRFIRTRRNRDRAGVKGVVRFVPAKKLTVPGRVPVKGFEVTVALIASELPMATVVDRFSDPAGVVVMDPLATTVMEVEPVDAKKLSPVPGV